MKSKVRVRFAPSPTGPLHIGGVRTALYNYLFARKHRGVFIVRIEDTDQSRYVANAEKYIMDTLDWCSIPFDEGPVLTTSGIGTKNDPYGPYRQSERKHLYKPYADRLIAEGKAYYAFDTAEELNTHRKQHEEKGKTFIYNWHNREKGRLINSLVLSKEEVKKRIDSGENYVIRFKSPQDEALTIKDEIRGTIRVDTNILDDKVLFKSDGMPTYHLANVVDDHLMEISHVIRGEEWLPSLALHVLLYTSFRWEPPKFAHLPLILKPVGKGKLSKRDGDKLGFSVFPLAYTNEQTGAVSRGYREGGYFHDAFINMLSLLGWNPGTEQEIFSLEELAEAFDLKKVNKSGAKFNPDKPKWFNRQYLQKKENGYLTDLYKPYLEERGIIFNREYTLKVVSLIKERAAFVSDFWELSSFFFESPATYNEKAVRKSWKTGTAKIMTGVSETIASVHHFSSENIESQVKTWITDNEVRFGEVMQPLRLSLAGDLKGPDLFNIMTLIGKKETIKRIHNIVSKLKEESI